MFKLLALFILTTFSLMPIRALGIDNIYRLHTESEEYNTRYFYCKKNSYSVNSNSIIYVEPELPTSFVVEIAALRDGEQTDFIYNDTKILCISKKRGRYRIGNKSIKTTHLNETKISLYYAEGKLMAYIDDLYAYRKAVKIDNHKKIGIKLSIVHDISNKFLYCYEPVPFDVSDYGELMEQDTIPPKTPVRLICESLGMPYSLTMRSDINNKSLRSMRFEYRFQDSKSSTGTKTQKARSEVAGVYATSPMNKWIIDFDLYIPNETIDDNDNYEILTQVHEGSSYPTTPAFYLAIVGGRLKCNLRGDSILIEHWEGKEYPHHRFSQNLVYLEKEQWHHIKIFLKESYLEALTPLTKIWVDGELVLESNALNCYNYRPRLQGRYGYFKYGIYKPGWLYQEECKPEVATRVYYFDNVVVKN